MSSPVLWYHFSLFYICCNCALNLMRVSGLLFKWPLDYNFYFLDDYRGSFAEEMSWSVIVTASPIAPLNLEQSFMASRASLFSPSSCSSSISYKSSSFQTSLQVTESRKAETVTHSTSRSRKQICKAAAEYKFPDPIPEFAEAVKSLFQKTRPFLLHFVLLCFFFFLGYIWSRIHLYICSHFFLTNWTLGD